MNWLADAWNWLADWNLDWLAAWFFDAAHNSSDWLRGLVDPGFWAVAVFSVWFFGSLIAGRLISLFVSPRQKWRLPDKGLRVFIWFGLVLILLGSVGWTIIGTTGRWPLFGTIAIDELRGGGHLLALPTVISDVAGIIVFGFGLGHRLRLQVEVTGRDGATHPVASAYVAARMEAWGTSRPRGLGFPHGTDVGNLPQSALSTSDTPQSKVAAAVIAIARSVALIIPWEADIVIVDSETAAVTLSRNGRRLESQLISTSSLLPDSAKREAMDADRALLTAAAALILFRLSDSYPKLKEGLSGAERWRSVVAQVLATTIPWKDEPETSTELFARAVDEDPRNLAAWLGYLVQRSGSFGTRETFEWWLESLEKLLKSLRSIDRHKKKKEIALHIRLLRTLTLSYTNYRLLLLEELQQELLEPSDRLREAHIGALQKSVEDARRKALVFATDLMNVVKDAPSKRQQPLLDEYVQRIKPLAASLYFHVVKLEQTEKEPNGKEELNKLAKEWWPKDTEEKTEMSSLLFHYDRACALVEEGDISGDKALPHLELALALKDLRADASSDPSLKPLRPQKRFAALTDRKVRIASLNALKNHSESLAANGIRFASDFLWRSSDGDKGLAESLKVSEETVKWMRDICRMAERCVDREMAADWTNLLTDEGIINTLASNKFVQDDDQAFATRYARIARRAEIASVEVPTDKHLKDWAKMPIAVPELATGMRRAQQRRERLLE